MLLRTLCVREMIFLTVKIGKPDRAEFCDPGSVLHCVDKDNALLRVTLAECSFFATPFIVTLCLL
jgi:hypothetical protein